MNKNIKKIIVSALATLILMSSSATVFASDKTAVSAINLTGSASRNDNESLISNSKMEVLQNKNVKTFIKRYDNVLKVNYLECIETSEKIYKLYGYNAENKLVEISIDDFLKTKKDTETIELEINPDLTQMIRHLDANSSNAEVYYVTSEKIILAGGFAAIDGPLPIGDLVAGGILIFSAGQYVVRNWSSIVSGAQNAYDGVGWLFSSNWLFKSKVDVSNRSSWTAKPSEEDVLDENNGEIGGSFETSDGMQKDLVFDKNNGRIIGEIHRGQPEYNSNKVKTGKVYPDHFHKRNGATGETQKQHYWWK